MFTWLTRLLGLEKNHLVAVNDSQPESVSERKLSQRQIEKIWSGIMSTSPGKRELMEWMHDSRFRELAMEALDREFHSSDYDITDTLEMMRGESEKEIQVWLATKLWYQVDLNRYGFSGLSEEERVVIETECWEAICGHPTEWALAWVVEHEHERREEAARLLVSIDPQSHETLRVAMHGDEETCAEAWRRLKSIATKEDLLWVIKEVHPCRVEATEMLLSRRAGIKVWTAMFSRWGWSGADACPTLEKVVQILERSLSLDVMSSLRFLPEAYTERIWAAYLHTLPSSEDLWLLVRGGERFSAKAWQELEKRGDWSLNSLLGLVYRGGDVQRTKAMDVLLGLERTPEWWDVMLNASRHAFGEHAHRAAAPIFENLEEAPDEILQSLSTDAWLHGEWREKARGIYLARLKSRL